MLGAFQKQLTTLITNHTKSSANYTHLEDLFKRIKTFQPEGTEHIESKPFEERAKLQSKHVKVITEKVLRPVGELQRDVISLIQCFARRRAVVHKKYSLICKIKTCVANKDNRG